MISKMAVDAVLLDIASNRVRLHAGESADRFIFSLSQFIQRFAHDGEIRPYVEAYMRLSPYAKCCVRLDIIAASGYGVPPNNAVGTSAKNSDADPLDCWLHTDDANNENDKDQEQ